MLLTESFMEMKVKEGEVKREREMREGGREREIQRERQRK